MLQFRGFRAAGNAVRLSFPNGEHADVLVAPGETTIGAAPGNAVVLALPGVQGHHAAIVADARGFVLLVRHSAARVHVNARPVREKAILRLGDVLSVDSVNILLKPDRDAAIEPPPAIELSASIEARHRGASTRAVLRGVSGPYFGKVVPIHGRLEIGSDPACGLALDDPGVARQHAVIEVATGAIYLRDLGSAGATRVNGVVVREAVLHPGDQIAFDRDRFLVEAPGMPVRRDDPPTPTATPAPVRAPPVTQTLRAIRVDEPAADTDPTPSAAQDRGWNPWALLAAAVLIAGAFALLIVGFR